MDELKKWLQQCNDNLDKTITAALVQHNQQLQYEFGQRFIKPERLERERDVIREDRDALLEQVNHLTKENQSLTEEISRLRRYTHHNGTSETPGQIQDIVFKKSSEDSVPTSVYSGLAEKYNTLMQQARELREMNDGLRAKNKDLKEATLEWKRYLDRRKTRNKPTQEPQPLPGGSSTNDATDRRKRVHPEGRTTPPPPPLETVLSPPFGSAQSLPKIYDRLGLTSRQFPLSGVGVTDDGYVTGLELSSPVPTSSRARALNPLLSTEKSTPAISNEHNINGSNLRGQGTLPCSSQATVDETATPEELSDNVQTNIHSDGDDLSVALTRQDIVPEEHDGSINVRDSSRCGSAPATYIRLKEERFSSPPSLSFPPVNSRTYTLDLDEPDQMIDTPRKRRRLREMQEASRLTSSPTLPSHTLTNVTTGIKQEAYSQGVDGTSPIRNEPTTNTGGILDNDVVKTEPVSPSKNRRNIDTALQPLDHNSTILPRTSIRSNRRRNSDHSKQFLGGISEDGESQYFKIGQIPASKENSSVNTSTAESDRRLQSLLTSISPEKRPLATTRTPISAKSNGKKRSSPFERNDNSTTPNNPRLSAMKASAGPHRSPKTPSTTNKSTPGSSFQSGKESLRTRPISRLTISDFKPNPEYNQGLTYAFSETVRSRDARRCLPGCTRPECCGSTFRALVEAGGGPTLPRGLFDNSQDGDTDEEDRLLNYYLGDAYTPEKKRKMREDERKELILQARTKLMADRHGKHRQAYERRATPPGFWRTDMPTTQEIELDREEARRKEREMLEERWREAMRPNGRWIFKDE